MSYVIGAWLSCAALLGAYAARTLRRERLLRRSLPRDGAAAQNGTPAHDRTGTVPKDSMRWR
jgi:energy-converting hydrogenase Eha subunit F